MKTGQVWNEDLGSAVSKTFYNIKEQVNMITEKAGNKIKLDITKCTIKISTFGMFELWLNNKRLKYISFNEYMRYRKYVIDIEGLENITN